MIITEAHLIYFSPTYTSKQVGEAIVHGTGATNVLTTDLTLKPVEERNFLPRHWLLLLFLYMVDMWLL